MSHSNIRPFSCDVCGKTYKYHASLKFHIRAVHDKVGAKKCSFCDRMYFDFDALRIHERRHTGEKPFRCEEAGCEAAYVERGKLVLHLKEVHGVDARTEVFRRREMLSQKLAEKEAAESREQTKSSEEDGRTK
jgi:hypothetical protein